MVHPATASLGVSLALVSACFFNPTDPMGTESASSTPQSSGATKVDPTGGASSSDVNNSGPGTSSTIEPTTTAGSTDSASTSGGASTSITTTGSAESSNAAITESLSTGATTGGPDCRDHQVPPNNCDFGQFWCTHPEACGPEGSELFRCNNGVWVPDPNLANDSCKFDGYDFAYGCVDDGKSVVFICGDGPGTDCDIADPGTCEGDIILSECALGKLTHYDCFVQCTEIGDAMMVLYDHGFCGDDMGASACICCDMGDPGCPI